MVNIDQILVTKLIKLGLMPLKRALVFDRFLIINSFYLESELLFIKFMGQRAFDPQISYSQRKKILKFLTHYINSFE